MPQNNIVEMKSYKEKRRAFLITLKEEIEPNQEAKPKGEIQIIDINRKKFTAKKSARKNSKEEQRKEIRKRIFKSAGVLAAITVTSAILGAEGASKIYDKYVEDRKSVTLEQALEKGKTAENLAISQEIIEKIEDMNETLGRGLNYDEMLEVARKFPEIQKSMLKEKIAIAMGVEAKDITFIPPNEDIGVCVAIQGKGCYEAKNPINQIQGRSISKDIINYIEEIIEAQGIEDDFKVNRISMEDAKAFYEKATKRMNQVAVWDVVVDERENIGVEKISQLELELDDEWEH
jgi:hypothetical protein